MWELPSDSYFFLENYQSWEIEELACVDNYLWSLLSSSFDRIEAGFVGIKLPEPLVNDSELTNNQLYSRSMALRVAKSQIHSLYADYLLSLSLPFLHRALRLDRLNMQREMSTHIHYDGQKRSLSTALNGFWKKESRERDLIRNYTRTGQVSFKDTVNGPNEGWLCVYKYTSMIPSSLRRTIQSLGYAFWDSQRLRRYGFVDPLYV